MHFDGRFYFEHHFRRVRGEVFGQHFQCGDRRDQHSYVGVSCGWSFANFFQLFR
jgi:hypothetical protein